MNFYNAFHLLFQGKSYEQAITELNSVWIDPRYYLVISGRNKKCIVDTDFYLPRKKPFIEDHHRLGLASGGTRIFPDNNISHVVSWKHTMFTAMLSGNEHVEILETRLNEMLSMLDVNVELKRKPS